MNQFVDKFGIVLSQFWSNEATEDQDQKTIADILVFANADPRRFKSELRKVLFDPEMEPLSVVLEALSKDTDTWGEFFVEILDDIFNAAYATKKSNRLLFNLNEFYYVEKDTRPFVQKIANKLFKELDSPRADIRIEVIRALIDFLPNPSIKNKLAITDKLISKLDDPNWKVRCITFQSLEAENLLPQGKKLRIEDKLRRLLFGGI